MAIRATRRVSNHHQAALQKTVANDAHFAIVFASIFDLKSEPVEDVLCIFEIQTSFEQCLSSFVWIVGNWHKVIVATLTYLHKIWSGLLFGLANVHTPPVANSSQEATSKAYASSLSQTHLCQIDVHIGPTPDELGGERCA